MAGWGRRPAPGPLGTWAARRLGHLRLRVGSPRRGRARCPEKPGSSWGRGYQAGAGLGHPGDWRAPTAEKPQEGLLDKKSGPGRVQGPSEPSPTHSLPCPPRKGDSKPKMPSPLSWVYFLCYFLTGSRGRVLQLLEPTPPWSPQKILRLRSFRAWEPGGGRGGAGFS